MTESVNSLSPILEKCPFYRSLEAFMPRVDSSLWNQQLDLLTRLRAGWSDSPRDIPEDVVILNPIIRPSYDLIDGITPREASDIQKKYPGIGLNQEQILNTLQEFPQILVYNQQRNPDPSSTPIRLADPKFEVFRQSLFEISKQQDQVIIAGFAGEQETVRAVLEAGTDMVTSERIIGVDAGNSREATEQALKAGCRIIDQRKALTVGFDWERIRQLWGLPYNANKLPTGKGTTHFVGILTAKALGLLHPETFLIHKDTDVNNPLVYLPELYMLLVRILSPNERVRFVQALRTGEGRNNEPWLNQANALANSRTLEKSKVGIQVASLAWPLSDSRGGFWSDVKRLPSTTSMGMETIRNVGVAGLSLEEERPLLAQVVIPETKEENKPSPPDREFSIVFACGGLLNDLGVVIKQSNKYPHNWTPDVIRWFNEILGGRRTLTFVPPQLQEANSLRLIQREFVWPSPQDLIEQNAVDLVRLKECII